MADLSSACRTTLSSEKVLARAVGVFNGHGWSVQVRTEGLVVMTARLPIPINLILFTIAGVILFVIPGLILYWIAVRPLRRDLNVVVKTSPIQGGTDVALFYSRPIRKLVNEFMDSLPTFRAYSPAAEAAVGNGC